MSRRIRSRRSLRRLLLDWFVSVLDGNGNNILASSFADQDRQTLFSRQMCADLTIGFEVLSGSGFAVDAILA